MIKLSFITDEAAQDPAACVALAQALSLDAVELRTVYDKHCMLLGAGERDRLRGQLRDAGLGVCCIDSPVFKCDLDAPLHTELDKLARCADIANYLGSPYVRIFSFWRTALTPPMRDRIETALRAAAACAQAHGIVLLVENGKRSNHATGVELAALLDEMQLPTLAALWDPANSVYGATDPDPLAAGYRCLARHIRHVHLKQVHAGAGGQLRYGAFAGGLLDFARLLRQLARDGFDGYASVETHWRAGAAWRAGGHFSEEQLDYPGGAAFSRGGEEATAESLRALQDLMPAAGAEVEAEVEAEAEVEVDLAR